MTAVNVKLNPIGFGIIVTAFVFGCLYVFGVPDWFHVEKTIGLKSVLCVCIDLAQKGGERVKSIHEAHGLKAKVKSETDEGAKEMLTEGDMKSHHAIFYGLQKAFPGVQIVSEEHEVNPINLDGISEPKKTLSAVDEIVNGDYSIPVSDLTIWVDPLDATQEYTESLTQYVTVMVCAAVRGVPQIGIIYKPFEGKIYWAWNGYGISNDLRDLISKRKETLASRKPSQKSPEEDSEFYNVIMSRSHHGTGPRLVQQALGEQRTNITHAGGAGYKSLAVISGQFDSYVHVTKIKKWDICAPNAVLKSSDGRMSTLKGKELLFHYNDNKVVEDGLLVTGSQKMHKVFLEKLADLKKHLGGSGTYSLDTN